MALSDGRDDSLAPWVKAANETGRSHLLGFLKGFAEKNNLDFSTPYSTLHQPLNSPLAPQDIRKAIECALAPEDLETLSELQLEKVLLPPPGPLPFTKPSNCSVGVRLRNGEFRIYPTQGTAWRFENPDRTCVYISQAGITVRLVSYETLEPGPSGPSLGLSATATHSYTSSPHAPYGSLTAQERADFLAGYRPIFDKIQFRTQWYSLQSMVKRGHTSLALKFVEGDFDDGVSAASEGLQQKGWTIRQVTLVRAEDGTHRRWFDTPSVLRPDASSQDAAHEGSSGADLWHSI